MIKHNIIYALSIALLFCSGCSGCFQNSSETSSSNQDVGLEDIVEAPPEKKVNQAPLPPKTEIKSDDKAGTTIGTFVNLEEGDYYYIHVKDENKKETSFTLWRAYEGAADLNVDNWKSVVGKKIKVKWEEKMEDIPEDGEKILVKKVLGVEILE